MSQPSLSLLASFVSTNGAEPMGSLMFDAAGDLFGTTEYGGASTGGTVFEIAAGTSSLTTIASLIGTLDGANPTAGLVADSSGDLFGTASSGMPNGMGAVFEIAAGSGNAVTEIASFYTALGDGPVGGLVIGSGGNLYGTLKYGTNNGYGAVFEIDSHTHSLSILHAFTGTDGAAPSGTLITDSAGDLFGTTASGGPGGYGTVFEINATNASLTTLAAFNNADGGNLYAGLSIDAKGDLFGTTVTGGASGDGTVFELVHAGGTYALTTLATFNGTNGAYPEGGVIVDAAGDVFGTTRAGGASGAGTVYEISGSSHVLSTVIDFAGYSAYDPWSTLAVDAAGNLYGTTFRGGSNDIGTVFEIQNAGYVTTVQAPAEGDFNGDGKSDVLWQSAQGMVAIWDMNGPAMLGSALVADPGSDWHVDTTGDFNADGSADILLQNDDGLVVVWDMAGPAIASGNLLANPGTAWHVEGTGDFNGDGTSDILLQNDDGSVATWTMANGAIAGSAIVADPGSYWHVVGTGDFNGDGTSDILLQSNDGAVADWTMNKGTLAASAIIADPGSAWQVMATGDFAGNGTSDIVLQSQEGSVAVWMMANGKLTASTIVADPGSAWHVIGTGDYAGTGKDGILLQDNAGDVAVWTMNGTQLASAALVGSVPVNWQTIGQGSINFINATQSSDKLAATTLNDEFVFTTALAGAHSITGFNPFNDLIELSAARFGNFAGVMADTSNVGGAAVIDLGGGASLTLQGVLPGQLTARNFLLG